MLWMRTDGIAGAKNLANEEPRALGVELDGYAHLPRMLDKARATLAGTAGRVRFCRGAQQARIVRAGEVVRIAAGVAWRCENTGDMVFRAVAVQPAHPR